MVRKRGDRETERQKGGYATRQTDCKTDRPSQIRMDTEESRERESETDRQTERETEIETDMHMVRDRDGEVDEYKDR